MERNGVGVVESSSSFEALASQEQSRHREYHRIMLYFRVLMMISEHEFVFYNADHLL